jgi:DNA-directed RNA polymerase specialized sigma24 family protein
VGISEAQKRRDKEYRRQVKEEWDDLTKTVAAEDTGTGKNKRLHRENKRMALTIIEDGARSRKDFDKVVTLWNKRDKTESERVGDHENLCTRETLDWQAYGRDTVIPQPLDHVYWRQLISGDFLDVIHDCPHELHETTTSKGVIEYLNELDERQKELLYYRAIRQWTPQKLAAKLDFTDRYIRKMYNAMMDEIRLKLFNRLRPRYEAKLPLTHAQQEFVRRYLETLDGNKDK